MTSLPEQLSEARRSQLEAQLDFFRTLTAQAFDSASQVMALNFNASRASVEQSSRAVRQLMSISDPRDLLALGTHTEEQLRTLFAYSRDLFSIASGAPMDLLRQYETAASLAAPAPLHPAADTSTEGTVGALQAAVAAVTAPVQAPAEQAQASAAPKQEQPAAQAPAEQEQEQPQALKAQAPSVQPQEQAPAAQKQEQPQAETGAPQPQAAAPEEALAKPAKKPVVAAAAEEAEPLPVAKAKPIAKAAGKVAKASVPHPAAAPVPGEADSVAIPALKPVEAEPPPAPAAGTPEIEVRQHEQAGGKRRK
jgi:phasin family protein